MEFEEVSELIHSLHRSMKNLIEIVFAISPLLALSTHGWNAKYSYHGIYLLRVS